MKHQQQSYDTQLSLLRNYFEDKPNEAISVFLHALSTETHCKDFTHRPK